MKCPVDQVELVMSERQGVEIDYCPTCRGIWLDRGELDKILDRAAAMAPEPAAPAPAAAPAPVAAPPAPAYGTPPADARPDTRTAYPEPRYADPRYPDPRTGYDDRRYDERSRDSSYDPRYADPRYRRKKKRESWLGDLLDFD